jgi:hypothetical protein
MRAIGNGEARTEQRPTGASTKRDVSGIRAAGKSVTGNAADSPEFAIQPRRKVPNPIGTADAL